MYTRIHYIAQDDRFRKPENCIARVGWTHAVINAKSTNLVSRLLTRAGDISHDDDIVADNIHISIS